MPTRKKVGGRGAVSFAVNLTLGIMSIQLTAYPI